jgi:hypothetical protein
LSENNCKSGHKSPNNEERDKADNNGRDTEWFCFFDETFTLPVEAAVFETADEYAQVDKLRNYNRKSESFIKEAKPFSVPPIVVGLIAFLVVGALVATFAVIFTQN